jgi:hypothetical protein
MIPEVAFEEVLLEVDRFLQPDASGVVHEDVVADLLVALKRRMAVLYEARETDVSSALEENENTLHPILRQIELTDRLIDLILYKLYGSTPAEDAVVDRETG